MPPDAKNPVLSPETKIGALPGIGPSKASALRRLGIETVEDLLLYPPREWEDLSSLTPIAQLKPEVRQVIKARILDSRLFVSPRKRMAILEALLKDESGQIKAVWFNQPYLTQTLKKGRQFFFIGTPKLVGTSFLLNSPAFETITKTPLHSGRLVPVYPETKGISSKFLRSKLRLLSPLIRRLPDFLPEELKQRLLLLPRAEAVAELHFPRSWESLARAKKRLAFDELLILQLAVQKERQRWEQLAAQPIPFDPALLSALEETLPFPPTQGQKETLSEILSDTAKERPMNRLLQGDVGSGKTAVAALATLAAVSDGRQVAWMAPTEVLAYQHFLTLKKLLAKSKLSLALLTSSFQFFEEEKVSRRRLLSKIKNGEAEVVVGTHALIQEGVRFKNLALVIVDEQHRFGVRQRESLKHKGFSPHFLSLTATPIPRTLALSVYGHLDLSLLQELPAGRKKIISRLILPHERKKIYQLVAEEIGRGRQAFIITPLIEESEKLKAKAATAEFKRLQKIFPHLRLGLLHGKLPAEEKRAVLEKFAAGKIQILVATTVIEVGIDVPNATVMLIENAERFGLAQLHQLRGRIGRGEHQAYCCVLMGEGGEEVKKRLAAFTRLQDGFALAELDLKLRGPGNFFGPEQSGFLANLKWADLSDLRAVELTQKIAQKILASDPELTRYPLLKTKVEAQPIIVHEE